MTTVEPGVAWRDWLARVQAVDEPMPFRLLRPSTVAQVVAALAADPDAAVVVGGGTELILELRRWNQAPRSVVSLTGVDELKTVVADGAGLVVGAAVSLADIADDDVVAARLPGLAAAARMVGVPQVRAQATVAGNLLQAPRCLYLRRGVPCRRNGADDCPAERTGLGADLAVVESGGDCSATSGSDLAAVFEVAGSYAEVVSSTGMRSAGVVELMLRRLEIGEVVTRIVVPDPVDWSGYVKVTPQNGGPFDTVGVAAGVVGAEVRVAVTGVAPWPWRWSGLERAIVADGWPATRPRVLDLALAAMPPARLRAGLVADAVTKLLDGGPLV